MNRELQRECAQGVAFQGAAEPMKNTQAAVGMYNRE